MKKNPLKILALLWLIIVIFSATSAWSQTPPRIYRNNIDGDAGTENPYNTGGIKDPNITVSGIFRSSGMVYSSASHSFRAIGWNSTTFNANDYFEWTMTPNEGFALNFTQVNIQQSYQGGQRQMVFRSSLDNFVSNIPENPAYYFNLSGPQFQNVTTPITFRMYVWNAANANNQYGIDFFTFFGTVTPALNTPGFDMPKLKYYPNPVSDVLSISNESEISGITVYNTLGQHVLAQKVSATEAAINMSALTAGVYLVRATSANGEKIIRIVKN